MIQKDDFSINELLEKMKKPQTGAIASFLGVVRGNGVKKLIIQCDKERAEKWMKKLKLDVIKKFEIQEIKIIYRFGDFKPGEKILGIAVSSAHRVAAFRVDEYLINELKKSRWVREKEVK